MGGYSSERLISLKSGGVVCRNLDKEKYNVYPVDISRDGWYYINELDEKYPVDMNDFTVTVDGEKVRFDAVFNAIEKGLCRYGVLPLENSTAGSVNAVYDLMTQHNFRIVRSVRIKVDHNLLANPGAKLENIREIYSHEQAISQCAHFLQGLPNVKVIRCENTAVAARMVAESGRDDVAALSSRACRELYGLDCLAASVQDQGNNYTRFICIAKDLEIYPGADRTSLMMVLPHKPGSLYKVLSRFYALGINLNKLESRPIPERDFEFAFYFDLDTSIYSPQFQQLMGELPGLCEEFSYLGSYREVV